MKLVFAFACVVGGWELGTFIVHGAWPVYTVWASLAVGVAIFQVVKTPRRPW